MESQDEKKPPVGGAGVITLEGVEALMCRGRVSLLGAARCEDPESFRFWRGYLAGLSAVANGLGEVGAAKDRFLGGYLVPGFYKAAYAALPHDGKGLTMAQVQQILRTFIVEGAPDPVADLQVGGVGQVEGSVPSTV